MITITTDTKLSSILAEYPWLVDEAVKIDSKFKILKSPIGKLFIKNSTISQLSEKAGVSADVIIENIQDIINKHEN